MAFLSGTTIVAWIYCLENAIANVAISAALLIGGYVDESTTPRYQAIKNSRGIEAVRIETAMAMSNQSDFSISCSRWARPMMYPTSGK